MVALRMPREPEDEVKVVDGHIAEVRDLQERFVDIREQLQQIEKHLSRLKADIARIKPAKTSQ